MTTQQKSKSESIYIWFDRLWWILFFLALVIGLGYLLSSKYCAYLGTDFRGYYASAQIALKQGFSQVYDPLLQADAQSKLIHQCPDSSSSPPLLTVSMPYLPVFVLLFLPLPLLEFTTSFYVWSIVNLVLLLIYLLRFANKLGLHPRITPLMQWIVCLPVLANLALGQVNVFLVICLGEFILKSLQRQERAGGLWLAAMLIKPHLLIMLLPGLFVARRWKILSGFAGGTLGVAVISLLLAGWQGVSDSVKLAAQFAGLLIQTGPTMTNWRALALNLSLFTPGWGAWTIAVSGVLITTAATLWLWYQFPHPGIKQYLLLVNMAYAAVVTISWHAHFYLLMGLIPVFFVLDLQDEVPVALKVIWIAGPPALFLGANFLLTGFSRNLLGITYLVFCLGLLVWSIQKLRIGTRIL